MCILNSEDNNPAILRKSLLALADASAALEIGLPERELLLEKLSAFSNQFIDGLAVAPAYTEGTPDIAALQIDGQSKSIAEILTRYEKQVINLGIRTASGGHLGFIPGGAIYASALADFLAAISNEYVGVAHASPGGVAIENAVIDWLKKIFGFPTSALGNLASGGSIANLIALTAARDKYGVKNEKITKSVIYLSAQAHHCIHKSLRIIGLEDVVLRYVPLDEHYRMKAQDLEKMVLADKQKGLFPYLIVASAGTTDVGAIDPLSAIADIAEQQGLWLHVDAAYGGFFILTSKAVLMQGIERADSLVVDPHKGMFLPYGLGAVLVKDAQSILKSNRYAANYMQDTLHDDMNHDPANVSPELTKHFRGLRLWLPLQLHGLAPFVANLEEKLLLLRYFRAKLMELGFCLGPEPDLSVSYFWYPYARDENGFNRLLVQHIHEDGRVFFSSTTLNGKFVIRIAILAFRTKISTIDRALEMLVDCLAKTKQKMQ